MTYLVQPAPILGPARCQGCGELVWWAQRMSRRLGINAPRMGWREDDGVLHRCPNAPIIIGSKSPDDGLSGATGEATSPRSPRLM